MYLSLYLCCGNKKPHAPHKWSDRLTNIHDCPGVPA